MDIDNLSVAAIRSTIIDVITHANSGHPGMALGSAPFIYVLFKNFINITSNDPHWDNRDRFVLASGHASSLLYTMLHLSKYAVAMDDLKKFRQIDSITPGHPEIETIPGIDASSGPLGQGVAQAVGLALAEKILSSKYNKEKYSIVDHYTYALCGDGDIQEGITQEAISLAGLWNLNKLILIYDSNRITLDGESDLSLNENVSLRFKACNWNVIEVKDGNDLDQINIAIKKARKSDKPTLIINHTIIGYGSIHQGTSKVHGSPLSKEDALEAKNRYNYEYEQFFIPEEVYQNFEKTLVERGNKAQRKWKRLISQYAIIYKEEFLSYQKGMKMELKFDFNQENNFEVGYKQASRNTSQVMLNLLAKNNDNFLGGSADVAASVMTKIKDSSYFSLKNRLGRNIQYGIREFAMASIQNGILLHRGIRSFVGSFLVFADYFKAAIRMACLQNLPAIYLLSHDSIAVGEDGPTHQPIEQLAMLRSIPNLVVFRPCDPNEVSLAYQAIIQGNNSNPVAIVLSRQNLNVKSRKCDFEQFNKGAYIYSKEPVAKIDCTILATGSEVGLAVEVQGNIFKRFGCSIRVVSMTSMELYRKLSKEDKEKIVAGKIIIGLEMLSPFGWHEFVDHVIGINSFGKSGKLDDVINSFDFNVDNITQKVNNLLKIY